MSEMVIKDLEKLQLRLAYQENELSLKIQGIEHELEGMRIDRDELSRQLAMLGHVISVLTAGKG